MDNTNIFYHSPKELTTDAFWVWLLYFLDSDAQYNIAKQILFDRLILKTQDIGRRVGRISVGRQKKGDHGRIDFVFTFTFLDDNTENQVLFEDKTWTTTTENQLVGYKEDYPNAYRYFYYKLAYISLAERALVDHCGYEIITSRMMESCLSLFCDTHVLITYYRDYVKDEFADYIDSFSEQLFENHNYDLLWDAQTQLFLADKLWEVLPEHRKAEMYIYNGTSSGRPWTEISISDGKTILPGYDESIFWRIDIRRGQFYIRLNQYSWYDDDKQRTIYLKKQERLRKLRCISDYLLEKGGYSLVKGKPTEVGSYEQEIVIFFLQDNAWNTVFKEIPRFTDEFLEQYQLTL